MSRAPVHVTAAKPRAGGHDAIWKAIRARRTFTPPELIRDSGCHNTTVRNYLRALAAAGIVAETADLAPARSGHVGLPAAGQFRPRIWKLVKDVGEDTPRVRRDGTMSQMGEGRTNLWRTLRYLKVFTARDLAIIASTETVAIAEAEARFYCKMLTHAGYLSASGGVEAAGTVYTFIPSRNTGPRPPKIQRTKHVYDANLNKVVWTGEAEEL